MGLTNYVSTYQRDFSVSGLRTRNRSMSATNLLNIPQVSPPALHPGSRGGYEKRGVTIDGREISSRPVYKRSSKSYTEPSYRYEDPIPTFPSSFFQVVYHGRQDPKGVTIDGRSVNQGEREMSRVKRISKSQHNLHRYEVNEDDVDQNEYGVTIDGRSAPKQDYPKNIEKFQPVTVDGRSVREEGIPRIRHTSYNSRSYNTMYGSTTRPTAWNGVGSTAPPIVDNYVDSHGLNPGLGISGSSNYPAVINTKPMTSSRMANYTRFSPSDWSNSNMTHYNSADNSRNNSERVRNEAIRLIRERDDRTVLTQRDSDRRIGERIHDISFWRSELQGELERNVNESHILMESRKSLERALAETEGPLRITSENIYNREGRKGIDLVNDNVENSLMSEVDTIKSSQSKLKKQLEMVNKQLGMNRNSRHQLERDLANKDNALAIDHTCHQMKNASRMINLHGGIDKIDPNVSIPETWSDNSNRNIQDSQSSRSNSQRMRADVDNLLTNCANEMWSSWNTTNTNFQQRISETHDAHNKLQTHLSKTMQEIYDQEKHIEHLKKAVRDKAAPLKVAQSRLEARTHRPDIELCRDSPHHRLVEEVSQIQESLDLLNRKLNEAENSHQDLLINKNRLEHDLKMFRFGAHRPKLMLYYESNVPSDPQFQTFNGRVHKLAKSFVSYSSDDESFF